MKIQIKEPEIIAAITEYLSQQGIRTLNKDITVSFTAGRKNTGLSAEVNIEEMAFIAQSPEEVAYQQTVDNDSITEEEVLAFSAIPRVEIEEVIEPTVNKLYKELTTITADIVLPVKTVSLFS